MLPVYCERFGLTREPFNVTPDPSFLYLSVGHREALVQLIYGIQARRGLVVLTGDIGAGKTTLIQSLLEEINDAHTRCALLFGLACSARDFLQSLGQELGLVSLLEAQKEVPEYLALLNRFLLDCYQNGDNVAVIIDEAQNLPADVLETLRLLSNLETKQNKLLQIVLVGQPELGERLNDPQLRQFKQRVALRHHLSFLSFAECKEYIAKRLKISGGAVSLFSEGALRAVHQYSGGIPRLINIICDNGLLSAHALRKPAVDAGMIDNIAQDLHLTAAPRGVHRRRNGKAKPRDTGNRAKVDPSIEATAGANGERQSYANGHSAVSAAAGVDLISADSIPLPAAADVPTVEAGIGTTADPIPSFVREALFDSLTAALTEATGPMATLILRDHLEAMGECRSTFPMRRLEQLLDQTGSEIANENLRERFRRKMCEEIYLLKAGLSRK